MKLSQVRKQLLLLLTLGIATAASAQMGTISINYEMAFPASDLKNFISENSFRGVSINTDYHLGPNFTAGIYLGWQVFNEKVAGEFSTEEADLFGTRVRYVNSFPLLLTGYYHLGESGPIRPFFGAGLGLLRSLQRTDVGIFLVQNNNWHFAVTPEVGVKLSPGAVGLRASVKYNYTTDTDDSFNYNYFAVSLGIMLADGQL